MLFFAKDVDGEEEALPASDVTVMDELMGMVERMDEGVSGFLCCLDDAVTVVAGVRVARMEGC